MNAQYVAVGQSLSRLTGTAHAALKTGVWHHCLGMVVGLIELGAQFGTTGTRDARHVVRVWERRVPTRRVRRVHTQWAFRG